MQVAGDLESSDACKMDVRDNEMWQEGGSGGVAHGCNVGDEDMLIQTSKFTCNPYLNLRICSRIPEAHICTYHGLHAELADASSIHTIA